MYEPTNVLISKNISAIFMGMKVSRLWINGDETVVFYFDMTTQAAQWNGENTWVEYWLWNGHEIFTTAYDIFSGKMTSVNLSNLKDEYWTVLLLLVPLDIGLCCTVQWVPLSCGHWGPQDVDMRLYISSVINRIFWAESRILLRYQFSVR